MNSREQAARTLAEAVPALLDVYVETADPGTAESIARSVEQLAQDLLAWHDRIAVGPTRSPSPHSPAHRAAESAPLPSAGLRAAVRRGQLPGSPVTLQLAAAELNAIAGRIEAAVGGTAMADDANGARLLDRCRRVARALHQHSVLLRVERDRLDAMRTTDQGDQVLARVVRAERGLVRHVTATLTA